MSIWEQYDLGVKILDILQNSHAYDQGHHLAQPRPFLTPYQIAIHFKEKYPQDFAAIGKGIGGKGHGEHTSFAQYVGRELSVHVKNGTMPIEGAFLYRKFLNKLSYKDGEDIIESSLGTTYDLSIFRAL